MIRYTIPALIALAGCSQQPVLKPIPVPPERIDCQPAGERPRLPAEDWSSIEAARRAIRAREAVLAPYILTLESRLFECANDDRWVREWQAGR